MGRRTLFGFERIDSDTKAKRVASVFASIATRYDLLNDVASLGLHRWWKGRVIQLTAVPERARILDLAGGTGDLTRRFLSFYPDATVILSDINEAMLAAGREKLRRVYRMEPPTLQCDAECLPFPDKVFDVVSIGFGLRNMTDKARALTEMRRVLKPGGQLVVLEFSKPASWFKPFYSFYSFFILPKIGKYLANDEPSYRYLVESIRMHPDQKRLATMMRDAGFAHIRYTNLTAGVVAVHTGIR